MPYQTWTIRGEDLEDRIDAEYYKPEYIEIIHFINHIKKKKLFDVKALKDITVAIRKGIFYILASEYVEKGVPFLRVSNLKDPLLNEADLVHITEEKNKEHINTCLLPGDLAISKGGYLGLVSIIPSYIEKCNISQDVIGVKLRKEYVPEYVLCYLLTKYGQTQLKRCRTQVAQPHLELEYVRRLQVILPSEDFQLKIKEQIKKAETLRERIKGLQLRLESLQEELGLVIPSVSRTCLVVAEKEMIDRLDPEFYYYKREIPLILQKYSYEVKPLTDVASLSKKKINPMKKPGRKIKYVEIADINPYTGEMESWSEILGAEAPSRARMVLKAGNLVLSSLKGSLRSIAIVPPELDQAIGTTGFFVLEPKEEIINKESLWWVLRTDICQRQLEQIASGTIMPAINEKELRKLIIPIPPPDIQKEIEDKVEEIQKLRREANGLVKEAIRDVEELIESKK
jgi:restriction endonuclease S subunit